MNLRSNIVANLLILAVGILLIVFCNGNVLSTLIIIIGIAFIIPCLANIIMILTRKEKDKEGNNINRSKASFASGVIASLGGIGLGTWMVISPESLMGIMVYLFAAMLVIAGLYNIIMLAFGHRPVKFPLWMYILPTLMIIAGIIILCTDIKSIESTVVLITGIAMVAFAINRFLELGKIGDEHTH